MDEEDFPRIWVCRDVAGEHVGGPECFCCPLVFDADTPLEIMDAAMQSAQRRQ
jgi:hypothetical protein